MRYLGLPLVAIRDAARSAALPLVPLQVGAPDNALGAAIAWLCQSHDVTGRQGSAKGYSLVHGWLPAYPETTGYVLGTLLEYARRTGDRPDLVERAIEMGRWEVEVQEPDGGSMEGHVDTRPRRSVVFNTGMVLHGWIELAMIRWARHAGDSRAEEGARAQLDWACSCQRANGWFDQCAFKPNMTPSTHALAYTVRGLLESYCLTGEERWLQAVLRTCQPLVTKLEEAPLLPGNFHEDWRAVAKYSCLTGTVQLGGGWLRLHQETGDAAWLTPGLRAVEQAAARQETGHWAAVRGALAGSFPVWGRYAPLQFPNWATKFLADALMLYDDCLSGNRTAGTESVTPAGTNRLTCSPDR
jgi:hypothetical protein